MSLISQIESMLFASAKPLTVAQLASACARDKQEVQEALALLKEKYAAQDSGLVLLETDTQVQLASTPRNANLVKRFLKEELTGEFTRPSLETLTVVAYRGPITKAAIEEIRGVNCGMILRSLLMRGLIEEEKDEQGNIVYRITTEFLRYLGVAHTRELPDYTQLHAAHAAQELEDATAVQ